MSHVTVSNWLTFLENRLAASSKQMDLLVGLAGLMPTSSLLSFLPLLSDPIVVVALVILVSGGLVVTASYLVQVVIRRRHLIFLMELILEELLDTPAEVADAYNALTREEVIHSKREGRFKRFYLTGTPMGKDLPILTKMQRDVLDIASEIPGVTQAEIAYVLDESKQNISYHIGELVSKGLVHVKSFGKNSHIYCSDETSGRPEGGEETPARTEEESPGP